MVSHRGQVSCKYLEIRKIERLNSLQKKILKVQKYSFTIALLVKFLEILENFPKIILAFATCGVQKYRPHHAVSLLQFSENLKKAIKKLNGNEQKKKNLVILSCDI